jgi:hypothetical protein
MKLVSLLLLSLIFSISIFSKEPEFINLLENRTSFETYPNSNRTFEEFNKKIKDSDIITLRNYELIELYNKIGKPTFVVLYNRLIDDKVNQPTVKIVAPSNISNLEFSGTLYLPINSERKTLSQLQLWDLEKYINTYFQTNTIRNVDRSLLMRLGKASSSQDDSVREIEIKSLSKGADYIFEILFSYNKDFKIKIISLKTGEIIFTDYSKNIKRDRINPAFSKTNNLNNRLNEVLMNLNNSLITHFKNSY